MVLSLLLGNVNDDYEDDNDKEDEDVDDDEDGEDMTTTIILTIENLAIGFHKANEK